MLYNFNYGSTMQAATEQDIEISQFPTREEMIDYALNRIRDAFELGLSESIFTISAEAPYEGPSSEEYQSALITRRFNEIYKYLQNQWTANEPINLYIFEWNSYEDALDYLKGTFETSSKGYN